MSRNHPENETGDYMTANQIRFTYIDSLRGLAALWVVFYHLWNRFYPHLSTQGHLLPTGPPTNIGSALAFFIFGFGYSGVTLFFVLSGLCIHLPQARREQLHVSLREFASRRFWRLYPAYIASILFSIIALAIPKLLLVATKHSLEPFNWWTEVRGADAVISACFLQPFWPKSLDFNGVYWTLIFEIQFYIAYPLLLWCLKKSSLVLVGFALLISEIYFALFPFPMQCFFPVKYFEWFLGVIAAEALLRNPKWASSTILTLCAVIGFVGGVFSVFEPNLYPFRDLLFAIGYFGLLLLVAKSRSLLMRVFNWRVLTGLGIFSYSLYLVHVPIIDLVWGGLDRMKFVSPQWLHLLSLISIPISILVAYVFYWLFERPFLRPWQKKLDKIGSEKT
jgi:peptidoglycan/LPS O-acetylase OafA/YrhL